MYKFRVAPGDKEAACGPVKAKANAVQKMTSVSRNDGRWNLRNSPRITLFYSRTRVSAIFWHVAPAGCTPSRVSGPGEPAWPPVGKSGVSATRMPVRIVTRVQ